MVLDWLDIDGNIVPNNVQTERGTMRGMKQRRRQMVNILTESGDIYQLNIYDLNDYVQCLVTVTGNM